LQWLVDMGIIVLAVGDPALLGIGGSADHGDQDPRTDRDTKLTPRDHRNAKGLWLMLRSTCRSPAILLSGP